MMMKGLLNRRHLEKKGKIFATVIPDEHVVHIRKHKFQDILEEDIDDLPYKEYARWLARNYYTERPNRQGQASLNEQYDQLHPEHQTTPTGASNGHIEQTSIFEYLEGKQ